MGNDIHDYKDILHLAHYQSATHPHMSLYERAAQFSPFSALTGYGDAIKETARLTDRKAELSEEQAAALNEAIEILCKWEGNQPRVSVTYFVADEKKDGGAYVTSSGKMKRLDVYDRVLTMEDRKEIPLDDIVEIEIAPQG